VSEGLLEEVAIGCRILALEGQGDLVWGHVSARDPEGRGIWMKCAGYGLNEITQSEVILVSWDGDVLVGDGRRHVEYPIHTELLRARSDINCVVHTHPPWANAFSATGQPLRPITHEACLFVPPPLARFTKTADLIVTRELGSTLAATVADRNAALMVNHGIVTCGADVPTGVMTAVLLERACRTNMHALTVGIHACIGDAEALAKREHRWQPAQLQEAWAYLTRQVAGVSTEGEWIASRRN
jgi:L-ribulose-5-phosphate 4-epimerase